MNDRAAPDSFTGLHSWTDGVRYVIRAEDLRYVGIDPGALAALAERSRPLGMSQGGHDHFLRTLSVALSHCAVEDADIRLQGSAAHLFSGAHKRLPQTRDAVAKIMHERLRRIPQAFEINDALGQLHALWPPPMSPPQRPFFDLLHRLRIDKIPSDIDVQVSSAELLRRAHNLAKERDVSVEALQVDNPHYGFLLDEVVDAIAAPLRHWADNQTERQRRIVAVKVFGGDGPPDVRKKPGAICSSHFQPHDWVLAAGNR